MILLIFQEDFSLLMFRYFLFNKPFNVITQFSASEGKQTLADYLEVARDIYPIGRLDYDSEGLLVLTNDKNLHYHLLDPRFSHPREYLVQVDGAITEEAISRLQHGVQISVDGRIYHTKPSLVKKLSEAPEVSERMPPIRFRKHIPTSWISIELTEGKNRQVRKMTAAVGYPTLRLIRWRIGNATIQTLKPGNYIELTQDEVYSVLGVKR
ncbi:MAG TPA: pseudouridine synthase [Flavitalea sp.]|nr:pseudouridine synthase [Flavitalea sp.]